MDSASAALVRDPDTERDDDLEGELVSFGDLCDFDLTGELPC